MEYKVEKLKNSRVKILIKANAADLNAHMPHIYEHLGHGVSLKGFRPGKAPRPLLVQSLGKGRILSELVDHVMPDLLVEAANKDNVMVIETPHYTLEKLPELADDGMVKADSTIEFFAEADVAPNVKVGDYKKISIKPAKVETATDKDVDNVLKELADHRATFEKVERAAQKDDRVEIDFQGKRNGIPEDRLASKNYPIVLGSNVMIPGFEDHLIGKKAGDSHTFEIEFPKDYHAKDLAGEKVVFEVKINEVAEKKQPELNDEFAKDFGHNTVGELREAIKLERDFMNAQKAKEENEAATLDEFIKLVKVELPESLVERELDRQMDTLRQQTEAYGLTFDHYLQHLKKTEEELRKDMRVNAQKAVTIGLGLGEVVKGENITDDKNPGYAAIEKLVEIATAAGKKPTKTAKKDV